MKYCGVTLKTLGVLMVTGSLRVRMLSANQMRSIATTVQARAWKPSALLMISMRRPVPKAISSSGMRFMPVGSMRIKST